MLPLFRAAPAFSTALPTLLPTFLPHRATKKSGLVRFGPVWRRLKIVHLAFSAWAGYASRQTQRSNCAALLRDTKGGRAMYAFVVAAALMQQSGKIEVVMHGPELVHYFYQTGGEAGVRYNEKGERIGKDGVIDTIVPVRGRNLPGQGNSLAADDILWVLKGTDPAAQGFSTAKRRAADAYFRSMGVEIDPVKRDKPFDPFGWRDRDPWNPTQRIR